VLSSGFHFSFISWSGTSSVWLPQVLFGLGAVTMAQNPDGILALTEEQSFRRKQKKQAKLALPTSAPPLPRAPLPADGVPAVAGNGTAQPVVARPARPARPRAADAALSLDSICAAYGETQVLFDLDLDVRRGKLTALVGANGAGKSTLCKVLAGLMEPTAGTITLEGNDITKMPVHRRAKSMLLAPESRGIFPGLSVEDNLMMLLPSADERDQAYARFPVLGSRRSIPAGNLSGGEQQMLTMAPVMVKPPALLIADEPTLGLAPLIVEQIMGVFAELRDQGVTLLVVEERAKAVLDIADDVALLELGRLVWDGPRQDLDPAHLTAIYLGQSTVEEAPTPA
jgi:ABC-type branched-subunit amino acid transport system ATPase component